MKDALGHGSDPRGQTMHKPVWYHGSPSGFPHSVGPVHVGTQKAARQALEARIGIPADLQGWNGDREYGKTLLAGKDTLDKIQSGQLPYYNSYPQSGYNMDAPKEDYYPKTMPKYSDGTAMSASSKPAVRTYQIIGEMTNTTSTPHSDTRANGLAKRGGKRGFYYKNDGEDSGSISAVVPNRNHLSGQMG